MFSSYIFHATRVLSAANPHQKGIVGEALVSDTNLPTHTVKLFCASIYFRLVFLEPSRCKPRRGIARPTLSLAVSHLDTPFVFC